jgi:hypothetical protein
VSEDAFKSRRNAELAMLALAAATLILADESEAKSRLDRASSAIRSWPSESRLVADPLERAHPELLFDLPPQLKLGWIDDHRNGGTVFARGYGVARPCAALDNLCRALTPGGGKERCKGSTWRPIRVVDARPPETPLRMAHADLVADDAARGASRSKDTGEQASVSRLREAQRGDGVGADTARAAQYELTSAEKQAGGARAVANDADRRVAASLEALRKASDEVRGADSHPGGRSVLLASESQPFFIAVGAPLEPPGACRQPCRPTAAGSSAPADDRDLDPSACLTATDVEIRPAGFSARVAIDALTRAGVWADIRERDVASALAVLADKETQAELEGELFGLKLHSTDAVRWAWLPIGALLAYALLFAGASAEPATAAPARRSTTVMWRIVVGGMAVAGMAVSVHRALSLRPEWLTLSSAALAVSSALVVLGLVLRALDPRPAPPSPGK